MEAVVGLLVMLFGVSHGVETHCDGRQDGAQCYGALGGTVDIQLMDNGSASRLRLLKNSAIILDLKNNSVIPNITGNRYVVIPSNRTFRISNLSINDGGNYSLQTFDLGGQSSDEQTLQLFLQAPVSSVLLLSECLSQGEMRLSCSSEGGDSPQYSWTLDGRTLTDAELLSGNNEGNNITLRQNVSGHLVCSVRNNVSNVSKGQRIPACVFINCTSVNGTQISKWVYEDNNTLCIESTTQPTTHRTTATQTTMSIAISSSITPSPAVSSAHPWCKSCLPLIGGVLAGVLIFILVVGVAVICAQRKKQNNKPAKQKEEEDDQDVTYADVRIIKRQGKQVEQRVEVEVEYGQVKFSKRPQNSESAGDDCVHANVHKVE